MVVREAIVTMIQNGLPVAGAVAAGIQGYTRHGGSRTKRIAATAGYAAGGYLGGWIAQRVFFAVMDRASGAALPAKTEQMAALPAPAPKPAPEKGPVQVAQPEVGSPADDIKPPRAGNGTSVVYHDDE